MNLTIFSLAVLATVSGTTALAITKLPLEVEREGYHDSGRCSMEGLLSGRIKTTDFDDSLESHWCNYPGIKYKFAGPGSSLKLSNCLANVNGKLVWKSHGGAMQTCTSCRLQDRKSPYLSCSCDDGSGRSINSGVINLNEHIYVDDADGVLACFGIRGTITTPAI
ncbi:hypothetical protein RB597_008271 [Gaeumannomyces tritici]